MTSSPGWLRGIFRKKSSDAPTGASNDQDPTRGQLELARTLARSGHLHDASREYANLSRKHATTEILLEHAELLLEIGDRVGAAFSATRVLEKEPKNARAIAVRNEVLKQDLQEQRP